MLEQRRSPAPASSPRPHRLAERTRSCTDSKGYGYRYQQPHKPQGSLESEAASAGYGGGGGNLRRTMSFDHQGTKTQQVQIRRAAFASSSTSSQRSNKLGSNPDLAWKELNEGLNNLFHHGSSAAPTPQHSPPMAHRQVATVQRHEGGAPQLHTRNMFPQQLTPPHVHRRHGLLPAAVQAAAAPSPHFRSMSNIYQAFSRSSLTSLDDEDAEEAHSKPVAAAHASPEELNAAEVYHTVHGVGAGRKKTLLASRRNEPFAKIVRRHAPASMLLSADMMPSLKEQRSNASSVAGFAELMCEGETPQEVSERRRQVFQSGELGGSGVFPWVRTVPWTPGACRFASIDLIESRLAVHRRAFSHPCMCGG